MTQIKKLTHFFNHSSAFLYIMLAVFFSRFIASMTHLNWAHPDEWYQTAELGHYIAQGVMSFTEVMPLHYRNLSWPMIISWVIEVSNWIDPHSISTRLWFIRLLTSILDFLCLFGVYGLIKNLDFSIKQKNFIFFSCALFWSTIADSVRPSQEHISQIFFWFSLFFYFQAFKTKNNTIFLVLSGIFCTLTGVVRYPSGLLSLGLLSSYFIFSSFSFREKLYIIRGIFLGLILGGLADLLIYDRSYESLWMYLQYNVFTTLGQSGYGIQSSSVYLELFIGRMRGPFILLSPFFIIFLFIGFFKSLLKKEMVVLPFIFYILGHLLIGHKESRFMLPIEMIVFYFTWSGFFYFYNMPSQFKKITNNIQITLIFLFILFNSIYTINALRGDFLKKSWSFQHLDQLLIKNKNICAVVSIHRPMSLSLPFQKIQDLPSPAYAYFPLKESVAIQMDSEELKKIPLIWIQKQPKCLDSENLLIHLPKAHLDFTQKQECTLITIGLQRYIPQDKRSGVWFNCPSSTLSIFSNQETRKTLSSHMPQIKNLPHFGISEDELKKLIVLNSEPGIQDGVMVDW